jgi:hypothetical protein
MEPESSLPCSKTVLCVASTPSLYKKERMKAGMEDPIIFVRWIMQAFHWFRIPLEIPRYYRLITIII